MPSYLRSPRARRTLAGAILLGGLAWAGSGLFAELPRETRVAFRLDRDAPAAPVQVATVAYRLGGEPVAQARFQEPAGLPGRFDHRVTLPPGWIVAEVEVRGSAPDAPPPRRVVRRFKVPAEGTVLLDLGRGDAEGHPGEDDRRW